MGEGGIQGGIPRPPEGWWEQVPVLRELYKLLSSDEPVNWDLARQVAVALSTHDEAVDLPEHADALRELEELSRAAAIEAERYTGLVPEAVAPVQVVSRAEWVEANISSFKFLMEPLAAKLGGRGSAMPMPPEAQRVVGQAVGVLLGLQTGFVLGYLGRHVIGQYEVTLPEPDGPRLLYVLPNLVTVEREWELDPTEFRYWIALHEVTHHVEFSKTWVRKYFHGQLRTLIDSLDFDPERMRGALSGLEGLDPQALADALQDPERLIQAAWTPLAEDTTHRLQAFMTLIEGYASFVMDAVGARVLKDHPRLREVMERRKREMSPGEALLERLLGLELKRQQYEDGVKFCRYVVGMREIEGLNHVWDNPDSLPTSAEIADPDGWITRVLEAPSE
jgi:coenzyme F420 biosynthesis associated uncharacterized protein